MIEHFEGIYFGGNRQTYDAKTNLIQIGYGSLKVEKGYTAQFFQNEDGSGGKSRLLYEGTYEDLAFYFGIAGSRRVDINETELVTEDFATVYEYKFAGNGIWYPCALKVPPGNWVGGDVDSPFDDNAIDQIGLAGGMVVHLHDDPNSEANIELQGPGRFNLANMRYENKVSRIRIEKDSWILVDDIVDWDNAKVLSTQRIEGGEFKAINRGAGEITQEKTLRILTQNEYSRSWEATITVGASVTVEGEAGIPLIGKVSTSVTASVEASGTFGGNDRTMVDNEISETTTLTTPPNSGQRAVLWYDRQKSEIPCWRVLKNRRTGEEIRQDCKVLAIEGINSTIETQPIDI